MEDCRARGIEPEPYDNVEECLIPNAETIAAIEDVDNGRNLSRAYTNVDEMMVVY